MIDRDHWETCFEMLYPYYPLAWTNLAWHCPTFVANKGIVYDAVKLPERDCSTSYSYNWRGMATGWKGSPRFVSQLRLGLGQFPREAARETEVAAPSEMYAVADTRPIPSEQRDGLDGNLKMTAYGFGDLKEAAPPHAQGYNLLFAEGHVARVKRHDYLYPPRSARHWNRDHQAHAEIWAPPTQWAVQN